MQLFLALGLGILFSILFPNIDLGSIGGYEYVLYTLLAIGLYGSVAGIDIREFHLHKKIIVRAVTFGVLLKSILIGGVLWLLFQTPYAFLFGVIVAQIDPLSVAHLLENKSATFSTSGRTILRAWSSFDDPMTVLLALYILLPAVLGNSFSIDNYFIQLTANLFFVLVLFTFSKLFHTNASKLLLLFLGIMVAVSLKLMLGIALAGLLLRPTFSQLERVVHICFILAAFILGTLVIFDTAAITIGVVLGITAYGAQYLVTYIVAPKLHTTDKKYLALAQFNGITSIILALVIAQYIPQTISVIATAIITINLLYFLCNSMLEKKVR